MSGVCARARDRVFSFVNKREESEESEEEEAKRRRINGARLAQMSAELLAREWEGKFMEDMASLGIERRRAARAILSFGGRDVWKARRETAR